MMPNSAPQSEAAAGSPSACPIAIVGIGCLFPKADGAQAYWSNIKRAVDAITDIPATHWKPEAYFDSDPAKPDMTYAKRGGFISPVDFNPLHHGIAPNNLEATDTTQLLGLMVAEQALLDANYETGRGTGDGRPFNRDRTSIILGVTGTLELVIPLGARLGHPIWRKALDEAGVDKATADDVVQRIANGYVPWQENSFPGLLGNVAAGRIANRFDLGGSNCVVDAACASSLSAIHMAAMELQTGRMDMVLTGGLDTFNDIFMYMCFSKTPALSPTGNSKPFSADGDGTILGEGLGIIALKRLDDAIRDGDKIYCVIKGIGSSSDGKGNAIYAPSAAGQVKCLTSAYREAGVSPRTIELIEAHGTGTKVGDGVEIKALRQVFESSSKFQVPSSKLSKNPLGLVPSSDDSASSAKTWNLEPGTWNSLPWAAVGSVKSMIGHTKAAAGVAGLIKAALALHHKVLPPTIKVSQPLDVVKPGESPVYLNTERRPWLPCREHPRRAGVSAFGFGGSNFHCVLEERAGAYRPEEKEKRFDHSGTILIAPLSADSLEALTNDLQSLAPFATKEWNDLRSFTAQQRTNFDATKTHRLVLVIERDRTDLAKLIASAQRLINAQDKTSGRHGPARSASPDGAYYASGPASKLAFLFPGQGSQYVGMLRELACDAPLVLDSLARANEAFTEDERGQRLSDLIYPIPVFDDASRKACEESLRQTQHAQPAIGAVSVGALRLLQAFNVKPSAVAGHSFGELVALHTAGRIDEASLHTIANLRGSLMAKAGADRSDRGAMLAVIASADQVEAMLREAKLDEVVIANRNSPTQMVLSGPTQQIERAATACEQRGLRAKTLPVSAAFHSALVADAQKPFAQGLSSITFADGALPVYANTTADVYPKDANEARALLAGQLAKPVDFIGMIEKMFADGIDTFIEVGPKSTLAALVKAILGERSHIALSIDQSAGRRSGEFDLASLLAQLAALGHAVDLKSWDASFKPQLTTGKKPAMIVKLSGANHVKQRPAKPRREVKTQVAVQALSYSPPSQGGAGGGLSQQASIESQPSSSPTLPQPLPKREGSMSASITPDTRHPTPDTYSPSRGHALNTNPSPSQQSPPPSSHLSQALAITQQSILALQRTQEQMAQLHRQYLEGQDAAQRTMAQLIEQQSQLLAASLGAQVSLQAFVPQPIVTHPIAPPIVPAPQPLAASRQPAFVPPTAPIAPAPAIPAPAKTAVAQTSRISDVLLAIVADKTGYPAEMLELTMTLDGDLGIDSIKRVEILSALQERLPDAPIVKPEDLGTLQTLGQIVEFLSRHEGAEKSEIRNPTASAAAPAAKSEIPNPTSDISTVLLTIVADKTGYPAEMLELTMTLDGDLGIDSIKRVEILSALQERLPDAPIVKPEDLGTLQTLGQIVDFLNKAPSASPSSASSFSAAPKGRASSAESEIENPQTRRLLRQCLTLTPLTNAASRKRLRLPSHTPVWITDDGEGLAAHLKAALEEQNIEAVIVPLDADPKAQPVAGLIVLSPAQIDDAYILDAFRLIQRTGPALRQAHAATGQHVLLTAITHLSGSFGLSRDAHDDDTHMQPLTAALAGIIKTASHEWPQVNCKVIDIEQPIRHKSELSEDMVDELLREGPLEVGMTSQGRMMTQLQTIALDASAIAKTSPIAPNDVIVITGGARGVTAQVAIAIARQYHCHLLLLGRSESPTAEPDWLRDLRDEGAIKKALASRIKPATPKAIEQAYRKAIANREVLATLTAIEAAGGKAIYASVDVRDPSQVASAIALARSKQGPIRGIIHGAGVLADRLIEDKTEDQFASVFSTKIDGFRALLAATEGDDLRTIVTFSSSTARFGRRGQVDYAAANEVLNKLSQQQAKARKNCRVLSINWGPWDGGMVTPALKKVFASEGVGVIGLEDGANYLADEIATPVNGPVEIVILGETGPRVEGPGPRKDEEHSSPPGPRPSSLGPAFEREVSLDALPMLRSHVIGGKAVLPMALMIEWLAHGAIHGNPGLAFAGVSDLRVFKGVKVDGDGAAAISIFAGSPVAQGNDLLVPVELRSGPTLHAKASILLSALLARGEAKLAATSASASLPLKPYEDGTLFHGSDLRAIRFVTACDAQTIEAQMNAAPQPSAWMKQPIRSAWLADPMALDGAFQLMIVWCAQQLGHCSLPTGLKHYRQFTKRFPAQGTRVISRITRSTAHEATADIEFLDTTGQLVARIEGYSCVIDGSLRDAFTRNQIQDSAIV